MSTVRLTLIGKPDCHLCEDAEAVVKRVITRMTAEGEAGRGREHKEALDSAPSRGGSHSLRLPAKDAVQRTRRVAVELEELNILEDHALAAKHSEYIPVVLINGKRHAIWKVDEERLTAAIEKAGKRRFFF